MGIHRVWFFQINFSYMPVKIRLARRGRKQRPFYHIVVADVRSPRDGRFIEKLGSYNPMTSPATIELDRDKALDWLMNGAQPTDTARAILKFKGVMYKKHLLMGVKKGALTEEKAEQLYQDFINSKDAKIAARFEATKKAQADKYKAISGKAGVRTAPTKNEEESPLLADVAEESTEAAVDQTAETEVAEENAETTVESQTETQMTEDASSEEE